MSGLIQKLGQVALPVRDLNRPIAFYRDVLGLRFIWSNSNLALKFRKHPSSTIRGPCFISLWRILMKRSTISKTGGWHLMMIPTTLVTWERSRCG